ncbi:MAG: 3-deoxy-7-phosphoheptulonate synthase [Cyclobacteriaceae bacterium]|nr:3-deoxy-7-phosphoheptulonate synthase [Cyclobacteriaceae bacterium HetDA_MAG_MS6]
MIIHLKASVNASQAKDLAQSHAAILFKQEDQHILVTSSKVKELPQLLTDFTDAFFPMESDIQLASRNYQKTLREIQIGNQVIGGNSNHTMMITGPCSIESWEQIKASAELLREYNLKTLRAGCFKPRTSPYTFQGLGAKGLEMLVKIREEYGYNIITEVKDSTHVDLVIEHADIIQIGAKAMYDQSILRKCGQTNKPILLKRGFGSTLQEFVQAAEFILSQGNRNVMLCERGIRTFETKTRFTYDLCGVAFLKEHTNLPIVLDPSHALGHRYGIADLTRASVAMGVEGLLIESHPHPEKAQSDPAQQLNFDEFRAMFKTLRPVASAIGRTII